MAIDKIYIEEREHDIPSEVKAAKKMETALRFLDLTLNGKLFST